MAKSSAKTETVTLDIPIADEPRGYASDRIDVRLTPSDADTMARIVSGLREQGATCYSNGRDVLVDSTPDAIRWMIQNAAAK